MSDSTINPMKKSDPHVLTFAPLRVVLKACDHLATTAGSVSRLKHAYSVMFNLKKLRQKNSKCRKPSRDEAIKISPKQKILKPLWMYY